MVGIPTVVLSSSAAMPVAGLGTASFPPPSPEAFQEAMLAAIAAGIRHFDTAAVYGTEGRLGLAVAEAHRQGLIKSREELFITTKLWAPDAHKDRVVPAIRQSLRESFRETCKGANRIVIDRRGFNAWKNMSAEERHPYVVEAERVNSAYEKKLLEEISDMSEVDDEADSATIWKFDKQDYKSAHGYYGSSRWGEHKTLESFDSYDWEMMKSWIGW